MLPYGHPRLAPEMRGHLDALLHAADPEGGDGTAEDEATLEQQMNAPLIHDRVAAFPGRRWLT